MTLELYFGISIENWPAVSSASMESRPASPAVMDDVVHANDNGRFFLLSSTRSGGNIRPYSTRLEVGRSTGPMRGASLSVVPR